LLIQCRTRRAVREVTMTFAERTGTERTLYFGIRRTEANVPALELGENVVYYQSTGNPKVQVEKASEERLTEIYQALIAGDLLFFGIGRFAEIRRHATGHVDLMIRSVVPDIDDRIV